MRELEIEVESPVVEQAEATGWLVRKVVYAGRRGAPDRWFFKGGKLVIMEFKRRGKSLDVHQDREKKRLGEHGWKVHVIDNVEDGLALLR